MASTEIEALTQALARLPGLGPRSARRAVLHLMKKRETALAPLLRALEQVNANALGLRASAAMSTRSIPAAICADPRRDARLLCVVEEVSDLWALDRSRLFPGRFHVLGGRLSALEGVRPEDLGIDKLVAPRRRRRHRRGRAGDERDARGPDHRPLSRRAARSASRSASPSSPTACRSAASSTISTKARSPRRCARGGRSPDRSSERGEDRLKIADFPLFSRSWPCFPSSKSPTRACGRSPRPSRRWTTRCAR